MTSTSKLAAGLVMIISFLSLSVYAQTSGPELKNFAAEGFSFDYPADYSITDESTPEAHQFRLTRTGSSVQLSIIVVRRMILRGEMPAAIENFAEPLVKKVATNLGEGKNPPERTAIKAQVGPKEAEGVRLRSSGKSPSTGEVIWLRLNFRLISLAIVRSDLHESAASQLWQTVRSSLKVEVPIVGGARPGEHPTGSAITTMSVLNGMAVKLPQPEYPALARAAHAQGVVTVKVLIDEQGNVISVHVVDGHPLLQAVSVAAARQAKFSPTLLEGEPVRVTGVITYNFVPR